MPVRQVAVTMGLNTEDEGEEDAEGLPRPPPPSLRAPVPTEAVVFGVSELELEIVGALSSSDVPCAVAG